MLRVMRIFGWKYIFISNPFKHLLHIYDFSHIKFLTSDIFNKLLGIFYMQGTLVDTQEF